MKNRIHTTVYSLAKFIFMISVFFLAFSFPTSVHAGNRYQDEEVVKDLASEDGAEVNLTATWDINPVVLPDGTREGYTLIGWYEDEECTKLIGKPGDTWIPYSTGDVVLYAKWVPKDITVSFDTNVEYTETGRYALNEPSSVEGTIIVRYGTMYGNLPTPTLEGYTFAGWYTEKQNNKGTLITKTTEFDESLYEKLSATDKENSTQTLYAHWINVSPKVSAKIESDRETKTLTTGNLSMKWTNQPVSVTTTYTDNGDGIKNTKYITSVQETDSNSYNSETSVTETYELSKNGTHVIAFQASDEEGNKTGRTKSGVVKTGNATVLIDTKTPWIQVFKAELGTYTNPLDIVTTQEWNDWKVYSNDAYNAKITYSISDKNAAAIGGATDVSKIKHAYIVVYDTNDVTNKKEYEIIADGSSVLEDTQTIELPIMDDFFEVIDLTYELHAVDNAGNESVKTVTTERRPEIFTKIERLTEDASIDPLTFKAGYRGRLYVYTTGWADTIEFVWPESVVKSGEYDKNSGLEYMIYNARLITEKKYQMNEGTPLLLAAGSEDELKNYVASLEIADENNPSSRVIYQSLPGESEGFVRCYAFDFWIPVYIGHELNPNRLAMDTTNSLNIKIVASKYILQQEAEAVVTEEVTTMSTVPINIGGGTIFERFRASIIN